MKASTKAIALISAFDRDAQNFATTQTLGDCSVRHSKKYEKSELKLINYVANLEAKLRQEKEANRNLKAELSWVGQDDMNK